MNKGLSSEVGAVNLEDLEAISRFEGSDFLPYRSCSTPLTNSQAGTRLLRKRRQRDRINRGERGHPIECLAAYDAADIGFKIPLCTTF